MFRLRIIAGPNGSGKTTLTKDLQNNYHINFGYYINADEIETWLKNKDRLSFGRYKLKVAAPVFDSFFTAHPLYQKCAFVSYHIRRNIFYLDTRLKNFSYFSALFADFLRYQLMKSNQTFTFETVMSGKDKVSFLKKAKENNYRMYLYYICTDDVLINKDRVADRVEKGGHAVPDEKIEKRYYGSLKNLLNAIKLSNRAYLFDNSGSTHKLVAEITDGRTINFDPEFVPKWFAKYVLSKL